jgi:hypothetical protein
MMEPEFVLNLLHDSQEFFVLICKRGNLHSDWHSLGAFHYCLEAVHCKPVASEHRAIFLACVNEPDWDDSAGVAKVVPQRIVAIQTGHHFGLSVSRGGGSEHGADRGIELKLVPPLREILPIRLHVKEIPQILDSSLLFRGGPN